MDTNRAYYIYLKGYHKGCGFTLEEWFEARDIVKRRKTQIMKLKERLTTIVPMQK